MSKPLIRPNTTTVENPNVIEGSVDLKSKTNVTSDEYNTINSLVRKATNDVATDIKNDILCLVNKRFEQIEYK